MFKKVFSLISLIFIMFGLSIQSANAIDTSDVYIPDPDVLNMTIIDADGNVLQEAEEEFQPMSTSRKSCVSVLGFEKTCEGNVGIFGRPGHRVHYIWYTHHDTYTSAFVRVRGYRMSGKSVGKWYWDSAGMGTTGSKTVEWGNVLSIKAIKVKSVSPPAGTHVIWH